MRRFFSILGGVLAMVAVALLCAFISMRLAIHGREVAVPNLAGRTDADAAATARGLGLNLSVENRFYSSAVAPNSVLSQSPAPGSRVRRGWQIRVTESLGQQKVSVPDVTGQTERPATLMLRHLQLDLATVAHLPAPAPAGVVLAQSPPANSSGLNGPRVALLVSDEAPAGSATSYVMPALVGLSLATASARLGAAGLHIASAQQPEATPAEEGGPAPDALPGGSSTPPGSAPALPGPAPMTTSSIIVSQSPAPGHRVTRGDAIRVTLAH